MIPFARLAAGGCPPHDALALALANEFHAADEAGAEAIMGSLADGVAHLRGAAALEQLAGVGQEVGARIRARVRPGNLEDLLLDRVLVTGAGDPVCWAVIAVQAAARVGIPLGIVADEDEHVLVAHRELEAPLVLEPQAPLTPIDDSRLPAGELSWRCSHQVALMLLDRIVVRAGRVGRVGDAIRAAELRLELPLDEQTVDALREERNGVASKLN